MSGGDLLRLMIERGTFEENFARFYVAEVGLFSIHFTLFIQELTRI